MNKRFLAMASAAAALAVAPLHANFLEDLPSEEPPGKFGALVFSGGNLTASRKTGAMKATGDIKAESGVYRFYTQELSRDAAGVYFFGENAMFTTCTNSMDDLHWKLTGTFTYDTDKSITVKDAWLYLEDVPVFWVPWAYYPLNTNYGFRMLPGYTKRWGAYLLSGYVYDLHEENGKTPFGLGGSTYLNLRQENGVEIGQTVRWRIGESGRGKIKGFYAWDEDYDHYTKHWSDSHEYNYRNWGSDVDRERYRVKLEHRSDFTERDSLNVKAQYLSDSYYLWDFAKRERREEIVPVNEVRYEHRENLWAAGATAEGPLNDFYSGVARLPEVWVSIEPQPVFNLPLNYESQTRAGFLNRQYAEYEFADVDFRYTPYLGETGRGADYQAFRADSAHRVTLPFMVGDVVSFVPRAGYRATWWSDSGDPAAEFESASGDALYRGIAEVGMTASARAHAWFDGGWEHIFEPYADYSFQEAHFGNGKENRNYIFDNYDGSVDWLDQFGFEGRGLPYSWHGIRPGIRNYLRKSTENGRTRPILDTDVYAAIPFRDDDYNAAGYRKDNESGNYNRRECVVPGAILRFRPSNRITLASRTEFDVDDEKVAYADWSLTHRLSRDFSWNLGYVARDHRIWDYLPSQRDRWNRQRTNVVRAGFEHHVCDWFAWAPYLRWDGRLNELDEAGAWFDFLTDCIGFRLIMSYGNSVERQDGSKIDSDFDVGLAIYLRAFGAGSMLDMAKF